MDKLGKVIKMAQEGDIDAQFMLGELYQNGIGIEQNNESAVFWYIKAAHQGHAKAQNILEDVYCIKAREAQADGRTIYQADLVDATEPPTGLVTTEIVADEEMKALLCKAEAGDAEAQYSAGLNYYMGTRLPQSYKKALYWYTQAAEQGLDKGRYGLDIWRSDKPQELQKAVEQYVVLAEHGDAEAQCLAGVWYMNGIGVTRDKAKAVEWFVKSAQQDNVLAKEWLGHCWSHGHGVAKDYRQAFFWYYQAARQGSAGAQLLVAGLYYSGRGVRKNEKEAAVWLTRAADQNNTEAQCRLGEWYHKGSGVAKDDQQAVYWITKAAEQDHDDAICTLGFCYRDGIGVVKDEQKAVYWLGKAAKRGSVEARKELDKIKRNGFEARASSNGCGCALAILAIMILYVILK